MGAGEEGMRGGGGGEEGRVAGEIGTDDGRAGFDGGPYYCVGHCGVVGGGVVGGVFGLGVDDSVDEAGGGGDDAAEGGGS